MFNLAIDSELRGCAVISLTVEDVAPDGWQSIAQPCGKGKPDIPSIRATGKKRGEYLFASPCKHGRCITTRQYARLVSEWIASIGLNPRLFGTHALRRTKATLIYRRAGNLLSGRTKTESTVRYLGIEVDDALAISEQVDV